MHQIAGGCC